MGGVGDEFCLFLHSGPLTFVEKSDSDPSVGGGACVTSLLVLMDRAQVTGEGSLGQTGPSPLPQMGGGGLVRLFLWCLLAIILFLLVSLFAQAEHKKTAQDTAPRPMAEARG